MQPLVELATSARVAAHSRHSWVHFLMVSPLRKPCIARNRHRRVATIVFAASQDDRAVSWSPAP